VELSCSPIQNGQEPFLEAHGIRELTFENQSELAEFVLVIARFSDEKDHHADMEISQCRKLRLSITTHDENGLTQKDFDWVNGVNRLIKE
jgi:pterin-4a-carbinolamine dehydratase